MSCSESEDLTSLENDNLQEKEFKAFLDNPLDFSKTLNQDYAILKFEQNYFEQEPFLTLTTRVKNADKLTQQKVLNQSLLEQRGGVSYFKFPKSDVTRFKNEMSFDIANEKVDFIDIDPIKMNVNKRLDNQLLMRQQEILTRLLEAEKADKQRDKDEKRKAESGKDYKKELPAALQEYLKEREAEVEMYKKVSPSLRPFYKQLVDEYYKALKAD